MNEKRKGDLDKLEDLLTGAYQCKPPAAPPDEEWRRNVMRDIRRHHHSQLVLTETRSQWPTRLLWQTAFTTLSLAVISISYAVVTDLSFDLLACQTVLGEPSLNQLIRLFALLQGTAL